MLKRLNRFYRLYKFLKSSDEIYSHKLTAEDVKNIALLYVDEKYKSLVKLHDNIIMDLENKAFREMENLEEFMGVKWARQVLSLSKTQVKNTYFDSIKKPSNERSTTTPEDFEKVPDGVTASR